MRDGPLAQLVEQLTFNQWVAGSNPARLTTSQPHSSPKCNTSGGGDRFRYRMMLRIGQQAATVPVTKQGRLPCPRATAT